MIKQSIASSLFAVSLLAGVSAPVQAQSQELEQKLAICAGINNPLERLVCFDDVVAGKQMNAVASQPNANASPKAKANAPRRGNSKANDFGREHIETDDRPADSEDKIYIDIVKHSENAFGYLRIETADGQVWQQTSSDSFRFDPNAEYYLERGLLSSYYLGRTDRNARTQVKRLK